MTDWFDQLKAWVAPSSDEPTDMKVIARAAAIILLEMAAADDSRDDEELQVINRAIKQAFDIDDAELGELIHDAELMRRESVSLHDFTRDLKAHLDRDERDELVEWLWRVAWADGRIDRYEEQLLRRLADLLGVPHGEFIRRKHKAAEAMGAGG